jgi:hypothetical protein
MFLGQVIKNGIYRKAEFVSSFDSIDLEVQFCVAI